MTFLCEYFMQYINIYTEILYKLFYTKDTKGDEGISQLLVALLLAGYISVR